MKSEERHEIEKNELEKLFDKGSERLGPYASYIIYGLLAIAALWAIVRLSTSSMANRHAEAWDSYTTATLPGRFDEPALEAAAEEHAGKTMGELAELAWADSRLAEGCRVFFANKSQAMEALDAAQQKYEDVAESIGDKALRGRAQMGVARTLEAKGEITEAIAAYEKVTGPFSEMADKRAELLGEVGAVDYAGWLAKAEGASRNFDPSAFSNQPNFSADALDLPGGSGASSGAATEQSDGGDFFDLLDRYQDLAPEQPEGEQPAADDMPAPGDADSAESGESGSGDQPAAEQPASEDTPDSEQANDESPEKPAGE